ncbi:MAG: cyclodeaminase/cyclohydrolase family protein, partial [Planctomycetes bacterium]|nr:cyclodeaminase/cyclohydrolase family protein [Planctomycetota bacterium]
PASTSEEKAAKKQAIQAATKGAIEAPMRVMEVSLKSMEVARAMAEIGLKASASDAGVAALAARTAVMGAYLNVKINAGGFDDKAWIDGVLARGAKIQEQAITAEREILEIVEAAL